MNYIFYLNISFYPYISVTIINCLVKYKILLFLKKSVYLK